LQAKICTFACYIVINLNMKKKIIRLSIYFLLCLLALPFLSKAGDEDEKTELIKKAQYEESVQNYWAAVKAYTRLLKLEPNSIDYYFHRGICRIELGDEKESIDDFTKVIELKPDHGGAYKERAIAYFDLKDYKNALVDNNKAIELIPH